jgi:hypothetical protein
MLGGVRAVRRSEMKAEISRLDSLQMPPSHMLPRNSNGLARISGNYTDAPMMIPEAWPIADSISRVVSGL